MQTFLLSSIAVIKNTKYNDIKCYTIDNFLSPNILIGNEVNTYTIDKETGLVMKTNMNNIVSERNYEFDNVDDSIFVEPNIGEYRIK